MRKKFMKVMSLFLALAMINCLFVTSVGAQTKTDKKVVWIGGSVTEGIGATEEADNAGLENGEGYAYLVDKWFQDEYYKDYNVVSKNVSLGGTTSIYASLRYGRDVLAENPDTIIIEFVGNDSSATRKGQVIYALESMIRRTLTQNPDAEIILLDRPHWVSGEQKISSARSYYEKVAEYYNANYIKLEDKFNALIARDGVALSDCIRTDGVHPTNTGHKYLALAFEECLSETKLHKTIMKQVPMMAEYMPATDKEILPSEYTAISDSGDWTTDEAGNLVTEKAGASVTYSFNGNSICLYGDAEQPYSVTLDGWKYSSYGSWKDSIFYNNMSGKGQHSVTITNASGKMIIKGGVCDGNVNNGTTATEVCDYSVYNDVLREGVTAEGRTLGAGAWKQIKGDTTHICQDVFENNNENWMPNVNKDQMIMQYKLQDTTKEMMSFTATTAVLGSEPRKIGDSEQIYFKATDENGNDVKVEAYPVYVNSFFDGWSSRRVENWLIPQLPKGTKSVGIYSAIDNAQGIRFFDVSYTYCTPKAEYAQIDFISQMINGMNKTASAQLVLSNGEKVAVDNSNVFWSTTDNDIITVDNGVVTAKGIGTALIYAEISNDGKIFEAQKEVQVISNEGIEDVKLITPKTTYMLGTQDTAVVAAKIGGNQTYGFLSAKFASQNENVVKIDKKTGEFKAIGEGKATITATVDGFDSQIETTVNVLKLDEFIHDVYDDNDVYEWANWTDREKCFSGTKLYAWLNESGNNKYQRPASSFKHGTTSNSDTPDATYFIYEVPQNMDWAKIQMGVGAYANDSSLGVNGIKFYWTEGTEGKGSYTDKDGNTTEKSISENMTRNHMLNYIRDDENGSIRSWWNQITPDNPNGTVVEDYGYSNLSYRFDFDTIPQSAKYLLIVADTRGTFTGKYQTVKGSAYALRGAQFGQNTNFAKAEKTYDGKLAFTLNKSINADNAVVSVKKNDEVFETELTYDASTYTYYVDINEITLDLGDNVTVTVNGAKDEFGSILEDIQGKYVVTDTREQIESIVISDNFGNSIDVLSDNVVLNISANVINTESEKIYFIAALFDGNEMKKAAVKDVSVQNSEAKTNELKLDLSGVTLGENSIVKIFVWDNNFRPIPEYKEFPKTLSYDF